MAIRVPVTIRFGDCDSASIVYYPRFFDYFHGAMEDAIRILAGMDYPTLIASHRLGFPAVRVECDFRRPLRYGDPVEIEVAIDDIGESSVVWRFRGLRGRAVRAPRRSAGGHGLPPLRPLRQRAYPGVAANATRCDRLRLFRRPPTGGAGGAYIFAEGLGGTGYGPTIGSALPVAASQSPKAAARRSRSRPSVASSRSGSAGAPAAVTARNRRQASA